MKMDDIQLEKLAAQCKLALTQEEKMRFAQELPIIMAAFGQMEDVALEDVPVQESHQCPLREDEIQPSFDRAQMLSNAPCASGEYWKVPKTVE